MNVMAVFLVLPDWLPWVAGTVLAIAVVIAISTTLDRKRTQALAASALQMGFVFCGKDWTASGQTAPHLETPLFDRGRNHSFKNIMTGSSSGMPVSLFDYSYTVGGGREQQTYTQTVAAYSKPGMLLPKFELHSEGLLEKIGDAIVHKDIRFDSHPEFSKTYRLRSPDPEKTRSVFTPALLSHLEGLDASKKWRLEGGTDTLIVYRLGRKAKPEDLQTFLQGTSAVAGQFFGLCGKGN